MTVLEVKMSPKAYQIMQLCFSDCMLYCPKIVSVANPEALCSAHEFI